MQSLYVGTTVPCDISIGKAVQKVATSLLSKQKGRLFFKFGKATVEGHAYRNL